MEAHRHFGKLGIGRSQGLSSRKNSVLIAVLSAVLAAALIYLFVTHYKKNPVAQPLAPTQAAVWVASHTIPKGTPESVAVSDGYFKQTHVPAAQAIAGAISDPSQVMGQVSTSAVAAGQQITVSDFIKTPAVLAENLAANQRAVAFSFDSEHGLTNWLTAGDTVDIMLVTSNKAELVEQNVTVLQNEQGLVVLKLTDKQALLLTGFTTKGSLWISLRPAIKATNSIRIYSQGA